MIDLLAWLLIACIIFGIVYWILTLLPIPPPFRTIVYVILALIFLLMLLDKTGFYHFR